MGEVGEAVMGLSDGGGDYTKHRKIHAYILR